MAIKKIKQLTSKKSVSKNIKEKQNSILSIQDSDIQEYANIFSEHKLKLLEIESGGAKIILKKSDDKPVQVASPAVYQIPAHAPSNIQEQINTPNVNTPVENKSNQENGEANEKSNYLEIKSPIVGTFYSAPSPESPPYVKEGDIVSADTVVAIVEAMKMMNEIKAGINGKIVRKLVDNNTAIEENAVLFLVEP